VSTTDQVRGRLSLENALAIPSNKKPPGFAGRFLVSQILIVYSPLPKRRDHHPARRGWVSVASEAGSAGAEGADGGSGGLWLTVVASGWALDRKLTFSRTVERRRAARSAS
jgi:hypothetical protein